MEVRDHQNRADSAARQPLVGDRGELSVVGSAFIQRERKFGLQKFRH
jgi:hypothetical protein